MVTWDDIAEDLNKATEAWERTTKSFKRISETFDSFHEWLKDYREGAH